MLDWARSGHRDNSRCVNERRPDRMAAKLYSASPTPAAARRPADILALGRGTARAALGPAFPGERYRTVGGKSCSSLGTAGSSFDGPATGAGGASTHQWGGCT